MKSLQDFRAGFAPQAIRTEFSRELRKVSRLIVTSAQNATPVHAGFWDVLRYMQKHFARRGGCAGA